MFEIIYWRAFLQVNSEKKALKILRHLEKRWQQQVDLKSCEKYWKDQSLYEVVFTTHVQERVVEKAVFKTMLMAKHLHHHWSVSGPHSYQKNVWELSGVCAEPSFVGISWISYELRNDDHYLNKQKSNS